MHPVAGDSLGGQVFWNVDAEPWEGLAQLVVVVACERLVEVVVYREMVGGGDVLVIMCYTKGIWGGG